LRRNPENKDMFLIALTGYGQAADRAASREAGFDEHFVKPVDIEALLRLLGDLRGPNSPAARRSGTRPRLQ
jgi:CheY-like chemotaxis protein